LSCSRIRGRLSNRGAIAMRHRQGFQVPHHERGDRANHRGRRRRGAMDRLPSELKELLADWLEAYRPGPHYPRTRYHMRKMAVLMAGPIRIARYQRRLLPRSCGSAAGRVREVDAVRAPRAGPRRSTTDAGRWGTPNGARGVSSRSRGDTSQRPSNPCSSSHRNNRLMLPVASATLVSAAP